MIKRLMVTAAIAAASFTLTAPAVAAVTNGGFETTDFTGWTQSGNTGFTGVDCPGPDPTVHSGDCSAFFGPVDSTGSISQTLVATGGQQYNLSFWLSNDGGTPNSFSVTFDGGSSLMTLTDAPGQAFTLYNFLVTPAGSSPVLTFSFRDDPSYWRLDDVSFELALGVPEPSTWAMMLLGFGAIGVAVRRSRKATAKTAIA